GALDGFNSGRVALVEAHDTLSDPVSGSLAAKVKGPSAVLAPLSDVITADTVRSLEEHLGSVRQSLGDAEAQRDSAQSGIQGAHREHADLLAQLEAMRARSQETTIRRGRLEEEAADVAG